ncbi:MAG: capsule assembly Wzi family protein [Bacteroidota bacterium]
MASIGFHRPAVSQSVSLSTTHEVYGFLKRLEARRILTDYKDAYKPLSRMEIVKYLDAIQPKLDLLTNVERDTYEYLRSEFSYEFGAVAGDPEPTELRWHLISLGLNEGILNADLNFAYQMSRSGSENVRLRSQGARFYGYAFGDVGFAFNFVDHREVGNTIDFSKQNTPDQGFVQTIRGAEVLEYNTTEAQLSWNIGEFTFALEKMHNVWGYGERGNVILSRKPPSAPQFRMRVPLASWMDFVYVLSDLHSNVIDSSRSYPANSSSMINFYRTVYRSKYMAGHGLEITITDGLDFSIGETVIYSDKGIQLMYLLPVMFFKSGEHYNRDTDNIQWFGSLDVNLIRNTNVYLSVLIDEISTNDLLNPGQARNQLGYTAGVHLYDLPLRNTEFILEYSRMNPWVYTHKFPAATFTNNGYTMGHWIGQNADLLFVGLVATPMYDLRVMAHYEHYRKGGLKDVAYQYLLPSQPFLYGPLHEERAFGIDARYQFVRDGFVHAQFRSIDRTDEMNPSLNAKGRVEFEVGVRYGVW